MLDTRERSTARGPLKSIWKGPVATVWDMSLAIIKTYEVDNSDTTKERLSCYTNAMVLNGARLHSTVSFTAGIRTRAVFGT